ncbi:MAG: hypothetical protein AMJ72_08800 [Acidithiobacillales bacterium SM1_46]|jgi:hypothetical protein|nr:MAG: hypothetical protein AMJ72_08800 [Acidithiobacillales bacterium SM1_46]
MRAYIYLAVAVGFAGLLVFTHSRAYDYGKLGEREAVARAVVAHQAREAELLGELETERKKVRVEYRERIKVVKAAADPAGCIDRKLPPALLQSLREDQP